MAAGAPYGMRPIGMRAQDSLRLEKAYGVWSLEFSTSCTPAMAGLERFVALDKGDFIGRDAVLAAQGEPPPMKLVLLQIDSPEADATGYEPIHHGGRRIGYITSGAYGHHVRQSLALAYVDTDMCATRDPLSVTIIGKPCSARILPAPPYDPGGLKLRG
jgi:dimethylglycine dehydrogenase